MQYIQKQSLGKEIKSDSATKISPEGAVCTTPDHLC